MAYRGSALRRGRWSEDGRAYFITACTHDRRPLFRNIWTGRVLVSSMQYLETAGEAHTLAYVIMPDHIHWLTTLGRDVSLSSLLRGFKGWTGRQLSRKWVSGPVWQKGFHDRAIRKDEDLRSAARYLVANPLRAGLADSLEQYSLWDAVWVDRQPL